jgi:DNA-binding CsgD family transcriptional regulator
MYSCIDDHEQHFLRRYFSSGMRSSVLDDHLDTPIIITNCECVIVAFNKKSERVLGVPSCLAIDKSLSQVSKKVIDTPIFSSIPVSQLSSDWLELGRTTSVNIFDEHYALCWYASCFYDEITRRRWLIFAANDSTAVQEGYHSDLSLDASQLERCGEMLHFETLYDTIECLPGSVYMKDLNGNYINGNNYLVNTISGFSALNDLVGLDDWGLMQAMDGRWNSQFVDSICQDDKKVITTGQPMRNKFELPFLDISGRVIAQTSSKFPLHDKRGRLCGLFGCSLDSTDNMDFVTLRRLYRRLYVKKKEADAAFLRHYFSQNFSYQYMITSRELDCWEKVALGYSNKKIACLLNISQRTVDTHLIHLREKLGFSAKSELIRFFYMGRK